MEGHPPWDGLPPPPRHAAPRRSCKAKGQCWAPTPAHPRPQQAGSGPRQPVVRMGRGRGRAPGLRRPSQQRKAPPLGTLSCDPHRAPRRLARLHAVGLVLGPPCPHHPCPGHTGNGSWPPAPRDGRPGEGQRLTLGAPHNGGRPPPLGRPPTNRAARSPLQGMQAKVTVLDPHARTPAPTARGKRSPTARPDGGQPGEDKRLTSDAPHNGAR